LPLYPHRPAVFELGARVERLLVEVPDHLLGGLWPIGALVGPLHGGDDVASVIAGEIGAFDERVNVVLHQLPLCCHLPLLSQHVLGGLIKAPVINL
jgi:hypothetical protein